MTAGYVDPVFPLPDPTFLWVHEGLVVHAVGTEVEDDEGRWRYGPGASVTFTGYVTSPDPRSERRGGADSMRVDAVCLAPRDVAVPWPGYLDATTENVPPLLRGWYEIQPPRPNPSHTRLLLTRLADDPRPSRAP